MRKLSEILADSLMKKGFGFEEIPELINDLILLLQQPENRTTVYVNQELENLGWGIQLLDESLFQKIVSHLVSPDGFIRSMEHEDAK
jgi:hypothetical protein